MAKFAVTFDGLLMDPHVTKLGLAKAIEYESSSTLVGSKSGTSGNKRHRVIVEAPTADAAGEMVMNALRADAEKFHRWEIELIGE